MIGCIYKIENKINGKCYIGKTSAKYWGNRWRSHRHISANKTIRTYHLPLYQEMREYDSINFSFDILFIVEDEDLLKSLEEWCIHSYNTSLPNGYNNKLGDNYSDELKQNSKSYWSSDTSRKFMSDISKEYWSNHENRKAHSLTAKESSKHRMKSIKAINIKTGEEFVFESVNECARQLNLNKGNLSSCLKGTRKTHKGYKFNYRYKELL